MKIIVTLLLSLYLSFAYGQSNVELTIQLISPEIIADANFESDPVIAWLKEINEEITTYFKGDQTDHDVMILITLHPEEDATIEVASRPSMKKSGLKKLTKKLREHPAPRTKFVDYALLVFAQINEGCTKEEEAFSPVIESPVKTDVMQFKELSLREKRDEIQQTMNRNIIPLLAHFLTKTDTLFPGVLAVGQALSKQKYLSTPVEELTDRNPLYWRANMEMEQWNQIIPFSKMCMYIANGEFDKAKHLLFIIGIFSEEGTLADALFEEISAKMDMLDDDLSAEIEKGIALHDKEKYEQAIAHYDELLKQFPNSAWLQYERYFSKAASCENPEDATAEWNRSEPGIYRADPLYHMNVHADNGKEAYLLFRRQEINELFKSQENIRADLVNYADIAFELENYGFAAQLYWLIISHLSKEDYDNRNLLAYFLYCLDKLGDTETVQNFKGDYPAEFKNIELERQEIMENSPMYKAFGNE